MSSKSSRVESRRASRSLAAAAASLAFTASHVLADEAASTAIPQPVRVCMTIANDSERLRCFDRTLALISANKPVDASTVSPEHVFGAQSQRDPVARPTSAPAESRQDLESITANVRSVSYTSKGALSVELDNGQRWRQSDDRRISIRSGDAVKITRASLGTFRLVAPNGRYARVERVR